MPAWIAGGAAIVGDVMASSGQSAANRQNWNMMIQNEQWQETMSNTAMQRRVTDLQKAGLNPLLAVGQGGASTPGISGNAMQNPNAPMANLGSQVASAQQLQTQNAQINLMKQQANKAAADTRNVDSQTDTVLPAQVEQIKSITGVNDEQAKVVANNVRLVEAQVTGQLRENVNTDYRNLMAHQQLDILNATKQALISSANNDALAKTLGIPGIRNLSVVQQSKLGQALAWINAVLQPVSSAVGIASKGAEAISTGGTPIIPRALP